MRGGELLPFYGDSKSNWTNSRWNQFMNRLGRTFVSLFVKSVTQLGWHECDFETERQLARPLCRIFPIGASGELSARANAKGDVFMIFCKEMSLGQLKLMLRGMHWWCFQGMTMFTGHKMGPPLCGTGNGRDGDKLLCNNRSYRELWQCQMETRLILSLHGTFPNA